MMTAKLFENGRSQAVRLPKECRFNGDEVAVNKVGDIVILMPKENKWSGFLNSLELFSDDFMSDGREQNQKTGAGKGSWKTRGVYLSRRANPAQRQLRHQ